MSNNFPKAQRHVPQGIVAGIIIWVLISVVALVVTSWIFCSGGGEELARYLLVGPISDTYLTMLSVAFAWALAGIFLLLVYFQRINSKNIMTVICFLAVCLLYINILRERTEYGDVSDYVQAAFNLAAGEPLHARYLYPPLWAMILQPLTPLGEGVIWRFCWFLNLLSLGAFYFLLQKLLQKYGFSPRLAALTTCAFLMINVPILRTLCYVQVNFHVANLIMLSLLLYPKSRIASALALSLATHLKVSPLLLVLGFLLIKDFRWIAWYVLSMLAVFFATVAIDGFTPYLDFYNNLLHIYSANPTAFRENSIDSFFRALALFFNMGQAAMALSITVTKAAFALVTFAVARRCIRRRTFYNSNDHEAALYNSTPILLLLMVMMSPLVWEHHPVLLALSYLVLLRNLTSARVWFWYGAAYFLEFLVPTFDLFPWSYGRLLSPLIILGLAWSLSENAAPAEFFTKVNDWLTRQFLPPAAEKAEVKLN
ncbi:MAG: glycosyltransferase family 87 protein [bacterium]|nr:glycosyltransferase family 87 protein [bacterium]